MCIPRSGVRQIVRYAVVTGMGNKVLGARNGDGTLGRNEACELESFLGHFISASRDYLRHKADLVRFLGAKGTGSVSEFSNEGMVSSDVWKIRQGTDICGEANVYFLRKLSITKS